MILLLGGTSESLAVAERLNQLAVDYMLSVVSDYGEKLALGITDRVIKGRLTAVELRELIEKNQITALIDITHPFATEVSEIAMRTCVQTNRVYLRFERPSLMPKETDVISVDSIEAACQKAKEYAGKIYLTTGSKSVAQFLKYLPKERLIVRVLPTSNVLALLEKYEVAADQIEAIKGPFSKELNQALILHNQAAVMITKESGHAGGFLEKLAACKLAQIPCIVIQRKQLNYPEKFSSIDKLITRIKEL